MKKLYTLIIAGAFLCSTNAKATVWPVSIVNFAFNNPNPFSPAVGDSIVWTCMSGTHGINGLSLPAGAAPFNSGTMSTTSNTTYSYKITVAGTYSYDCSVHGTSMPGNFTASGATGVADQSNDFVTAVYPSPFKEKATIKYNGIESIAFYNVLGEKVKSAVFTSPEGKIEVDFESLPAGIYFYRTYKEGVIFETRKIVKGK